MCVYPLVSLNCCNRGKLHKATCVYRLVTTSRHDNSKQPLAGGTTPSDSSLTRSQVDEFQDARTDYGLLWGFLRLMWVSGCFVFCFLPSFLRVCLCVRTHSLSSVAAVESSDSERSTQARAQTRTIALMIWMVVMLLCCWRRQYDLYYLSVFIGVGWLSVCFSLDTTASRLPRW